MPDTNPPKSESKSAERDDESAADKAVEDVIEFFQAGGPADSPAADADAPPPPG